MKRIILTFVLFGLLNYCFGQNINKQAIKEAPLYILDYDKEDPVANWLDVKELDSNQLNTKVLSDGMVINSTKHFMQIKELDMAGLVKMPQMPIDTTMYYHIQIIREVKD